jgi:hypothetical protein
MAPGTRLVEPHRAGPPFAVGVLAVLGTRPVVTTLEPLVGVPRWVVVAAVVGVGVVGVGCAAALGSLLATDVGLRALAPDRLPGDGWRAYRLPAVAGVGVALVTLAIRAGATSRGVALVPFDVWAGGGSLGVLASVAGGVVTELVLRYGFMTLVVWAAWTYRPAVDRSVTGASAWVGVLAAATLGGSVAVPAALVSGTTVAVAVAAVVPFVGGVAFGLLYWRYDLAAAVVAHGAASLVRAVAAMV